MRLSQSLWIEGPYYIEYDHHRQLNIVGPNNHLHFGSRDLYADKLEIDNVETGPDGRVRLTGQLQGPLTFLPDPVIGHIRKVRKLIEKPEKPNYAQATREHPGQLVPSYIGYEQTEDDTVIYYRRLYGEHWYGVRLELDPDVRLERSDRRQGFRISAKTWPQPFTILPQTDQIPRLQRIERILRREEPDLTKLKADWMQAFWRRTTVEIDHMISYGKTSGYDYGTVFPRDWMESADLGRLDLEPRTARYMYERSMEHIDRNGEGWHEEIIGEYKFEERRTIQKLESQLDELINETEQTREHLKSLIQQAQALYINRNMVDIEPRYMLGLDLVLSGGRRPEILDRLRRVAAYLVGQAKSNSVITFKEIPVMLRRHRNDRYYQAGNWRDSELAFKRVHPVIAPYDVNVVFYPQALKVMRRHWRLLQLDKSVIDRLVKKWDAVKMKERYRFINPDGEAAYALALYDVRENRGRLRYQQLAVNHTDEAYELFYGSPTEAEVTSLCRRLLSRNYFYTPSGPTVVGAKDGYETWQYHGRVIWTKQTAYLVAGLRRLLDDPQTKGWSEDATRLIKRALKTSAETSFWAWAQLDAIPELHIDDHGRAAFYIDQPHPEGPMNTVQLWSSVGARRIIRAYLGEKSSA